MLVLTRKPGEDLVIAENIHVRIMSVSGKHVRIGIEAPKDVTVFRGEVIEKIAEENRRAAEAAGMVNNPLSSSSKLFRKK